jgi:hypothetical protein
MAQPVEAQATADAVFYISASAGDFCSYFVRSDGAIDRTLREGKIAQRLIPSTEGVAYTQAAFGRHNSVSRKRVGSAPFLLRASELSTS